MSYRLRPDSDFRLLVHFGCYEPTRSLLLSEHAKLQSMSKHHLRWIHSKTLLAFIQKRSKSFTESSLQQQDWWWRYVKMLKTKRTIPYVGGARRQTRCLNKSKSPSATTHGFARQWRGSKSSSSFVLGGCCFICSHAEWRSKSVAWLTQTTVTACWDDRHVASN